MNNTVLARWVLIICCANRSDDKNLGATREE